MPLTEPFSGIAKDATQQDIKALSEEIRQLNETLL